MRGLLALFQSREQALGSFHEVGSWAPDSRLTTLSTSWIDLQQASGSAPSVLDALEGGRSPKTCLEGLRARARCCH